MDMNTWELRDTCYFVQSSQNQIEVKLGHVDHVSQYLRGRSIVFDRSTAILKIEGSSSSPDSACVWARPETPPRVSTDSLKY